MKPAVDLERPMCSRDDFRSDSGAAQTTAQCSLGLDKFSVEMAISASCLHQVQDFSGLDRR
jgi:hypothetical protein